MTRAALIPETVWLSSRALDALDEFGLVSGREHASWLFGLSFDDAVEIHMVDGWVRGDQDSVEISRDTQLERRYENDGLQLVGHLHSHACWVDQSPEDERCWTGLARELGRPIVGLIVGGSAADSPFPFAAPLFGAWMAGPNRIRRISVTKEPVAPLWF